MSLPYSKSFTEGRRGMGGRKLAVDILPEDKMAFRLMLESSQGYGMNGVREWLQNRFGALEFIQTAKKASDDRKRLAPLHTTVITPQSVPEFVIPLTGSDVLRLSHSLNDMKLNDFNFVCNSTEKHDPSYLQGTQEPISGEKTISENQITKTQRGKNKKKNSRKTNVVARMLEMEQMSNDGSSSESGTNDDLKSAAAVSLPHLRTFTSFGFTTLKESPHTRRKESLLLGTQAAEDVKKLSHSRGRLSPTDEGSRSSTSSSRYTNSASPNNLSVPRVITPSLSINSLASDLGISSADLPMFAYCQPASGPSAKVYKRRRSSTIPRCSESDHSLDSDDTASSRSLSREEARLLAPLGEIKLSLVYDKNESTLKLLIIKAENIASRVSDPEFLSIFVKTCLLPDRAHRQTSMVVRGTHNPHFNQQFIFKDIKMSCLEAKYLRLKICNQLTSRKHETLGEVLLQLDTLKLQHGTEVRMWRDLEAPSTNHMLGSVRLSATFQPRKDNLNITIIEVKSLPRQSLSRAPDPYVKVIVKQDRMQAVKKQTKSQKNSTNAAFDETFNFTISPNVEALRYTTVTIQVLSKERLRNDSVLGQVTLGYSSITNTELLHWTQVLGSPNLEVEQLHKLRPLKCKG